MVRPATIGIVQPAGAHRRSGNRVTALRWASQLRALGHRVVLERTWSGRPFDVLLALHAEKSADSVARFAERHPDRALLVAATGTDLYHDGELSERARASLALATRIVVLQPDALERLPAELRPRARVVLQSALPGPRREPEPGRVLVLAHLRAVKDPLLPARAVRDLPPRSRIFVELLGRALDPELADEARREERANPRFRWPGERPHGEALAALAGAWLAVVPSRHEGGSNATSEAFAAGVGVLATDIPGNRGLLGDDHPGLFPPGDAAALRALLLRAEEEPGFHAELAARSRARAAAVAPARERAAWRALLDEVSVPARGARERA